MRPAIHANASYEGKYPLVSALSRPVIVKHLVSAARQYGADAVAHGCTGKGNDQVRFEVGTRALAPDLEILAPARVWGMSREAVRRVRGPSRHPGGGDEGEDLLDRREPVGPGHRVRRDGGPLEPASRRRVRASRGRLRPERLSSSSVSKRGSRSRSTAGRSPWTRSSPRWDRWSAPMDGVGSTWSRTAGSG